MENGTDYSATAASPAAVRVTVPADCAGLRLDQCVARILPQYSRSRIQSWIRDGHVSLDGAPASQRSRVWGGEHVEVIPVLHPSEIPQRPEAMNLSIIHEDESLLVIDKPPGLVVHPGSGNWQGTLLNALLHHVPALARLPRAGIVHRLDKDTSGLLVVAKTLEAHASLVRQLQDRTVRREYLALVQGLVQRGGRVEAPVGRHPSKRTQMAVTASGKTAITHYEVVERFAACTLLRCRLETGRTHQIRVHMQSIGHPLVGDRVYGRAPAAAPSLRKLMATFPRQALHAARLELLHPASGLRASWEAPLPADMRELLAMLREMGDR